MKTLFERGLVAATDGDKARTVAASSRAGVQSAEAQLLVAETQIATSESQVRLAQAQVETYRATLQLAETNLSNTRLLAPFTGYISQRNLDPGASVSAGSSGTNTSSLGILMLQDIATVKVQVEIPERQIARITPGLAVRLAVDPYKAEVFKGTVTRVVRTSTRAAAPWGSGGHPECGGPAQAGYVRPRGPRRGLAPRRWSSRGGPAPRQGKPTVMAVEGIAQSVAVEVGGRRFRRWSAASRSATRSSSRARTS